MAKKHAEPVAESNENLSSPPLDDDASFSSEENVEATTVETVKPSTITDAAISGDTIYFIKGNMVIRKNKHGEERQLFDFNSLTPPAESVTVEGFYLDKLVFLVDGKLFYLTERSTLGLLAE